MTSQNYGIGMEAIASSQLAPSFSEMKTVRAVPRVPPLVRGARALADDGSDT